MIYFDQMILFFYFYVIFFCSYFSILIISFFYLFSFFFVFRRFILFFQFFRFFRFFFSFLIFLIIFLLLQFHFQCSAFLLNQNNSCEITCFPYLSHSYIHCLEFLTRPYKLSIFHTHINFKLLRMNRLYCQY